MQSPVSGKGKMEYGGEDAQLDYPELEDKTGWWHYKQIFQDKNGVWSGGCRWFGHPPVPIEGDGVPDPDV